MQSIATRVSVNSGTCGDPAMKRSPRILSLVVVLSATPAFADPQVVAHRGLIRHAPENTLANFAACLHLKIGFELDVRRSADGILVCLHDDTVERTTNDSGQVADLTLEQLRELDAGSWFHPRFAGERVPTLDEVFALIAEHPPGPNILVDLKFDDPSAASDILRLAAKHQVTDRLVFIGLVIDDAPMRRRYREADPHAHLAALAQTEADLEAALADADSDWAYLRFLPTADQVKQIHAQGKQVIVVGTLVSGQEPDNWQTVRSAGVDAMLTDWPLECLRGWAGE